MLSENLKQLISLVGYGNNFLRNSSLPENFSQENPVLQSCGEVVFKDVTNKTEEDILIAENPEVWFSVLKESGCRQLKLLFQHVEAKGALSSGSGGRNSVWYVEAGFEDGCDIWLGKWRRTEASQFWSVSYEKVYERQDPRGKILDLVTAREVLTGRLDILINYTINLELGDWDAIFEDALTLLFEENPEGEDVQFPLIPPELYPFENRQLLAAAEKAWVFEGKKSWNEIYFEDYPTMKTYYRLSFDLYDDLCNCISSALSIL